MDGSVRPRPNPEMGSGCLLMCLQKLPGLIYRVPASRGGGLLVHPAPSLLGVPGHGLLAVQRCSTCNARLKEVFRCHFSP